MKRVNRLLEGKTMCKFMFYEDLEVSVLLGKTMKSVVNHKDEEIIFSTSDGEVFKLLHDQD